MIKSQIYLDESGDLGWTFSKPYRNGGSSRFLTIAYLICPITHSNIPKRLVKDFYQKYNFSPRQEMKASVLKSHHKEYICEKTVAMMRKYPDFHLGAITVNKENVSKHIQQDGNVLYNYLIGQSVIDLIQNHETSKITRDNRNVKKISGNSCIDYLQTMLWMHLGKSTILTDNPTDSHNDDGIIFIDWITNIVWSKYEDKYSNWCNLLQETIQEKTLFF